MGITIGEQINMGMTFMLGHIFVLGSITLYPDSTGYLGQVKTFAIGRILRFGNLEYITNSCGELVFMSSVSNQIKEQFEMLSLILMSNPTQDECENLSSGPTSG